MSKFKIQSLTQFFTYVGIIIASTFILKYVFFRIDLTSEKRYTLSDATKTLLNDLEDEVFFKIYLEGSLPAEYKKLQRETREMLDEFRVYAKEKIHYEFINPSESSDENQRMGLYKQLSKAGLEAVTVSEAGKDNVTQQIIFPGALVTYRSKETAMQILKTQIGNSQEAIINSSIENLEYELSNTIRKLTRKKKEKIAILNGHKELEEIWIRDFIKSLKEYYEPEIVILNHQIGGLQNYKSLIVAKPDSIIDEKDKFIIDQFIMKGGKVLWLLDAVSADMDSLQKSPVTYGVLRENNLDDMLFRYGARINPNLVMDMQAAPIPMITGMIGNVPQRSLLPWYYFPLVVPKSNHPIVKNLNAVKFQFVSEIDTIPVKDVSKTILLSTSNFSKTVNVPVKISLDILKMKPQPESFQNKNIPLAVLLEGKFQSSFKNRLPYSIIGDPSIGYRDISELNKMIIVSDGDIVRNQISKNTNEAFPLGFDRYSGQTFGNKNFLLNCINYLMDESGLISIRTRELKLRLMDLAEIEKNKTKWQLVNIVSPLVLLLLLGAFKFFIRNKKYSS